MPEVALNPSDTIPDDEAATGIRWTRVLIVAASFFLGFYVFEHSPEQFAGGGLAQSESEDRQKNQYIDKIEDGSSLRKLVVFAYAGAGLVAMATCRSRLWNPQRVGIAFVIAFVAWAGFSVLFSDLPSLTIRRLASSSLLLLGSAGFARMLRPSELVAVTLASLSAFVSYSLFLDVGAGGRPWQGDYRFGGTIHPNIQAAYCGVLCLAAFTFPAGFGSKWAPRSLLVFGFVMLLQTQSRTSAFAVLMGLGATFVMRLNPSVRWAAGLLAVSLGSIATITIVSLDYGGRVALTNTVLLGRTEQASSLTGRVPLWEELSRYAAQRPITGFGYESFWTPDRIDAVMRTQDWALQSAHNGYFELILQLGFIGLVLGVGVVVSSLTLVQSAYARTADPGYAFVYGTMAFALIASLLESHFVKIKYPTVLCTIAVMSVLLYYPKQRGDAEGATPERLGTRLPSRPENYL